MRIARLLTAIFLFSCLNALGRDVGNWTDSEMFKGVVVTYTLSETEGSFLMVMSFREGARSPSLNRYKVREVSSQRGRKFIKVERDATGDHWVVAKDGRLELRDDSGLIKTLSGNRQSPAPRRVAKSTVKSTEEPEISKAHQKRLAAVRLRQKRDINKKFSELAKRGSGEVFKDVTIRGFTDKGVTVFHATGAATILWEELPASWNNLYKP